MRVARREWISEPSPLLIPCDPAGIDPSVDWLLLRPGPAAPAVCGDGGSAGLVSFVGFRETDPVSCCM
jgi:hypothetical protein